MTFIIDLSFEYHLSFSFFFFFCWLYSHFILPTHSLKKTFLQCWHSTNTKPGESCSARVDWGWKSCSQSQATLTDVVSLLSVSNFPEGPVTLFTHTHTLLLVFQTHSKMGNVPFRWKYNSKLNSVDFKVFINKLSWSFSIYAELQRGRKSLNHDSWQI